MKINSSRNFWKELSENEYVFNKLSFLLITHLIQSSDNSHQL